MLRMITAHARLRLLSLCLTVVAVQGISPVARAEPVATVSPEEIQALVQSNQGKVVVLNFWASWCPPCLEEFPDIIEVYDEYHSRGLEVIAVSMNADDELEDIDNFLQDFVPPFTIYRSATQDEAFYDGVIQPWYGEIPMTLIYDTSGERIHVHKKALTHEELVQDVAALLPSL